MSNRTEIVVNIVLSMLLIMCIATLVMNLFICCSATVLIINEIALMVIIYALYATLKERIRKV